MELTPAGRGRGVGVGVALYECLAGRPPVPPQETLIETIEATYRGEFPPVDALRPGVPAAVAALVACGLARDPAAWRGGGAPGPTPDDGRGA